MTHSIAQCRPCPCPSRPSLAPPLPPSPLLPPESSRNFISLRFLSGEGERGECAAGELNPKPLYSQPLNPELTPARLLSPFITLNPFIFLQAHEMRSQLLDDMGEAFAALQVTQTKEVFGIG